MINVMLVDDHNMIREGIKKLLEFNGDIKVIAECSNGQECIDQIDNFNIDIILLDINMPVMNGIETLYRLRKNKKDIKVLLLTVHNEVEYLVKATDIGVEGYILKDAGFEELRKAIITIYDGESYIQPKLIPSLNNYLMKQDSDKDILASLTRREIEVLRLLAIGSFNKDIADELDISERTVKNHISSIFKKIDVSDRTQAAVFAIKNNLVSL